jgi:hypothetical protein
MHHRPDLRLTLLIVGMGEPTVAEVLLSRSGRPTEPRPLHRAAQRCPMPSSPHAGQWSPLTASPIRALRLRSAEITGPLRTAHSSRSVDRVIALERDRDADLLEALKQFLLSELLLKSPGSQSILVGFFDTVQLRPCNPPQRPRARLRPHRIPLGCAAHRMPPVSLLQPRVNRPAAQQSSPAGHKQ